MEIRNRNKCKGKIRKSVLRLFFQGDKTVQQRLKKPGKGVQILSPRWCINNEDYKRIDYVYS